MQKRCKTCDLLYEESENNQYPGYCSKKCYKFDNKSKIRTIRKNPNLFMNADLSIVKECSICKKPFNTDKIKNENICNECKNDIKNNKLLSEIKKDNNIETNTKSNKLKNLLDFIDKKQEDVDIITKYKDESEIKIEMDEESTDKLLKIYRIFF